MRGLAVEIVFEAEDLPVETVLLIADVLDRRADRGPDFLADAGGPMAVLVMMPLPRISPASTTSWVVVSVSQAIRASGSLERNRSTIASLNLVGDLVGVAFGNGFGREKIALRISWEGPRKSVPLMRSNYLFTSNPYPKAIPTRCPSDQATPWSTCSCPRTEGREIAWKTHPIGRAGRRDPRQGHRLGNGSVGRRGEESRPRSARRSGRSATSRTVSE